MEPDHIGRFEIKAEVGRGGMATVYRAYDPRFKREVAIKILPSQFLHDPTFRARFEREAEVIAAIEHPSIVPVYDFGEENGQPYLVMRYMHGGSLSDLLKKGPLSFQESARIITQLAPALDEMHSQGIVHRDLKPGNILFDQYRNACISDFGIARLKEATTTLTGDAIIGTPSYMSPEQARGETDIDGRSDIYALGAILFEMLTGKQPYQATTPMGIVMKHITEPVPRIQEVRSDLPSGTETVIARAMAKQREDRFPSARDMASAQEAVVRNASIGQPDPAALEKSIDKTSIKASSAPERASPLGAAGATPPPGAALHSATPYPSTVDAGILKPSEAHPASQTGPAPSKPVSTPALRPVSAGKPGRPRSVFFIFGGIAAIIGLCLLAGALGIPSILNIFKPSATKPAAAVIPAPAELPTDTPGAVPDTPPRQQVDAFIDDFSKNDTGWDRREDDGSITDYEGGFYRIYVDKPNIFYWANPGLEFSDVSIEVDATKASGPDANFFGLVCRYKDPDNFYMLAISSDGYYSIQIYKDGEFAYLGQAQWEFSDAIHQGKTTNRIRGDCIGDTLTLYANGNKLSEVIDATFQLGDIGLTAASLKMAGTNILFDNFIAKKP